jgi:hypothetical protein
MSHTPEEPRDAAGNENLDETRIEDRTVVSRRPGSLADEPTAVTRDETDVAEPTAVTRDEPDVVEPVRGRPVADRRPMAERGLAAQRERFGGFKLGAALFGWLCATGVAVLLAALLSAGGAALALTNTVTSGDARANASTIGIGGGILLVVVLAIAYFAGGYVAGRLARFDGARQGLGVWIIGVVLVAAFAVAGWLFGSDYNVLNRLNLPNIPIDQGSLTTGGIVALVALALATLIAAMLGGKVGERYHRKIDDAGYAATAYAA